MMNKILNKIKSIFNFKIISKNLYNRFILSDKEFDNFAIKCVNNEAKYQIEVTKLSNGKWGYAVTISDFNYKIVIKHFIYDIFDDEEREFAKLQAIELLEMLKNKNDNIKIKLK